jgi:peroxiredoxin
MLHLKKLWNVALLGALFIVYPGCSKPDAPDGEKPVQPAGRNNAAGEGAAAANSGSDNRGATAGNGSSSPAEPAPPAKPVMPKVELSAAHAATSILKVGDTMPDAKLQDLDGHEQSLSKLLGEKATVLMFWTASWPYAAEKLADLQADVAAPYSGRGVKVVAIHEGVSEAVRQTVEEAGAEFHVLLDPEGSTFAKVATEILPRIYLLDAHGKILWFDLEYSRDTQQQLEQALAVVLGDEKQP